MTSASNTTRIAKNTLLLYIRQFMVLIVGLYTVRIVLKVLGEDDYGVYNVVGGIVSVLSFINSGMVAASQRFISFELGTNNLEQLKKVFSISVTSHFIIAIAIIIIAETLGLWFINTQLNIPADRNYAANWVYQCSIITFIVSIISVPYNSCIIAHEHMKIYAYVSIIEGFCKLGVAFALCYYVTDSLILYSVLLLLIQIIIRNIYTFYCKRKFQECYFKLTWDKQLFKKMLSFANWSIVGNLGFSLKDQGTNFLLNIFCGTSVNAARGIAMQVSNCVNSFSNNFAVALTPQITKQYAAGNYDASRNLVYKGARLSFFLMSLIAIPLLINADYMLQLWLEQVPEYTSAFVKLILIASLMYTMTQPITNAIQATGNIKTFQIYLSILLIIEIPIVWLMLKNGVKPYLVALPSIFIMFSYIYLLMWIIKKNVKGYNIKKFTIDVILKCFFIFVLSLSMSYYIRTLFIENLFNFFLTIALSFLITLFSIIIFGITKKERITLVELLKTKINHAKS